MLPSSIVAMPPRGIPFIDHDKTDDCPNLTFSDNQRSIVGGKISLNVSRRVVNPACIAGVLTSASEIQRPVRPHEVVVAAKQLQVKTFLTNHVGQLISIDFFTVPTLQLRVLYVFVVLAH